MSLDTVVEDIRDEARTRADEIRAEGEERAEEIVAAAESDAEEIRAEAEQEAERTIEQEREQALSSAKLEAKQERLEARREMLQTVREAVEERIADLEGERREALTRTLLTAAAPEFEDADDVTVRGAEGDEALLETVCEDHDGFAVGEPVSCLGGVVVESGGSRVRVNNTFDSVLDEVWEDNLRTISERLFEER
jgi:V/A-type H+-transporting ATPase subunit E